MADLRTTYMGIGIDSPIIVGASSLSSHVDTIKRVEDEGAAAIVIKSLFEEQINRESYTLEQELHRNDSLYGEMITIFPEVKHAGPEEHLMWIRKTKESVKMPLFASLNATKRETWIEYALKLEQTGADGLELNFYATPMSFEEGGEDIESAQIEVLREIKSKVRIPISVKLSPFYTSPLNFIRKLDAVGVDGYVLFNRFFQPSIDTEKLENEFPFNLSNPTDHRLALRYTGLLAGEVKGSICGSNGIHSAEHVAEMMLAGADCVQVVSVIFRNSIKVIGTIKKDLADWMDKKSFASVADFKGRLSRKNNPDTLAYSRAQYVKILLKPGKFLETPAKNWHGIK